MSVLVTGGAGYIGSHVTSALLDRGEHVVVLDDLSNGIRGAVPADALFVAGDIGDQPLVDHAIRTHAIDAILHLAGSVVVADSIVDPLRYYLDNTAKSRALFETAVGAGVKDFVFSSSAAVYGTPDRIPVAEDDPKHPASPYGMSKLMAERMLQDAAAAHGLRFAILRYFNVAGVDPSRRTNSLRGGTTHLITAACDAALGHSPGLTIFGTDYSTPDGTCIRDYIHISDLVEIHCLLLDRIRGGGDSVVANCGYGHGHSVREVVDAAKRVSGRGFPVREGDRRAGDAPAIVANADLLRRLLPFTPRYDDLEVILRHSLEWNASRTDGTIA